MKPTFFAVLLGVSVLTAQPAPSTNAFSPDQIQFGAVPPFLPPVRTWRSWKAIPLPPAEITPSG